MYRFILINRTRGRYILKHDPIGWDASTFTLKRSTAYHGVTFEYSQELLFIKDGKEYIQAVYEAEGIEGKIDIIIQRLSRNSQYETEFIGVINFTLYEVSATQVKTNIEQTGFTRRFTNSDEIDISLNSHVSVIGEPLAPFENESVNIQLHSKIIAKLYEARISKVQGTTSGVPVTNTHARNATIVIGWDEVIKNELKAYTYATGFSDDKNIFEILETEEKGPFVISVQFKALWRSQLVKGDFDAAELQFFFKVNNETPTRLFHDKPTKKIDGDYTKAISISYQRIANLEIGDKLYFWGEINLDDVTSPLIGTYEFINHITPDPDFCRIRVAANTQTDESPTEGILVHEAGARLVQAMTGTTDSFVSNFFGRTDSSPRTYPTDGKGSLLLLTNGYQIRNFPRSERPVTTTFKKFYEAMNALFCVGVGVEVIDGAERVRMERREHFYQNEIALELGQVSDLKKSVATEYYYNQAETGFQKWQISGDGGLDEFNSKRSYALPITQIKKTYSAVCPYIGGGYLIETTRREQYTDTSTKDNSNDSEVFVICILRNGPVFVTERAQAFTVIENVLGPDSVYNARITPARILRNHGAFIKAGLLHQLAQKVRFASGEGNTTAKTRLPEDFRVLAENDDFLVAELPNPFFVPEYYSFTCDLRANEIRLIRENPYKLIKFKDNLNNDKYGYIIEVKASTLQASEIKLLKRFE